MELYEYRIERIILVQKKSKQRPLEKFGKMDLFYKNLLFLLSSGQSRQSHIQFRFLCPLILLPQL